MNIQQKINRFFLGFFLFSLVFTICQTCNRDQEPHVQDPAVFQKQQQVIKHTYQKQVDYYTAKADSLEHIIAGNLQNMQHLDSQVTDLRGKVRMLALKPRQDTLQQLADCRELQNEAIKLVEAGEARDSLCNETVEQLTASGMVKDSLWLSCHATLTQTDSLLSESIVQQNRLQETIFRQHQQLKARHRQISFLAMGLLVLSSVSTALYVLKN